MSNSEKRVFEKIKKDLDKDELDKDINDRMFSAFATKSKIGYMSVMVAVFILTGLLVWLVIKFYQADDLFDTIFWGLQAAVVLTCQAFMKLWFWLEMNRVSLLRKIKRLELEVAISNDWENKV